MIGYIQGEEECINRYVLSPSTFLRTRQMHLVHNSLLVRPSPCSRAPQRPRPSHRHGQGLEQPLLLCVWLWLLHSLHSLPCPLSHHYPHHRLIAVRVGMKPKNEVIRVSFEFVIFLLNGVSYLRPPFPRFLPVAVLHHPLHDHRHPLHLLNHHCHHYHRVLHSPLVRTPG